MVMIVVRSVGSGGVACHGKLLLLCGIGFMIGMYRAVIMNVGSFLGFLATGEYKQGKCKKENEYSFHKK